MRGVRRLATSANQHRFTSSQQVLSNQNRLPDAELYRAPTKTF
jgi:hypothetical protein